MAGQVPGTATGPAKLKAVTSLVDKLTADLDSLTLSASDRNGALEELKIYGRDPTNAAPIFTRDGISMLLRYAFDDEPSETSRAALRVLANAMLLKPDTRKLFVDRDYAPKACGRLRTDNWDDEFLVSRIFLLSTYGAGIDLPSLVEKHQLAENVAGNIARHAQLQRGDAKPKAEPMEEMALGETLRLAFNITHFHKESVALLNAAVPDLVELLWRQETLPTRPLDSSLGSVINALLNLEPGDDKVKDAVFPESEPHKVVSRLIQTLDKAMNDYGEHELETSVAPTVSLLCKLHEHAPENAKQCMRESLLPTSEDREAVLGHGQSLSAKLLKNSTNPLAPQLRDAISHLLFDMSDRDASKFVDNVGYGYASGFLFQNNIPVPASVAGADGGESGETASKPVNPITGQFLDREREKETDLPEMTEEEKEREAERLFVLFERLKQTGVVDVQNPVEMAARQGKFRELKDDEVEELD